ncbi:C39 family peptidase [Kribbella sp. NPDC056345]|uniref:C39 family peptidase n=1 Tax=Kribbella sp. NPDC056345 TaxID=3345789 RepID=UPI0035D5E830
MTSRRTQLLSLAAAVTVLAAGVPASAQAVAQADPVPVPYGQNGNWTGADIVTERAPNSAQAIAKSKLAAEYAAVVRGKRDRTKLAQIAADYAAKYGGMAAVTGQQGTAKSAAGFAESAVPATQKVLQLAQYEQEKNYWCGPAAAYMIMKYLGITTSRYAGYQWGLSQNSFASVPYLKTEQNGATRFALNVMAPALNRWRENKAAGFYVQYSPSALPASTFGDAMVYSVNIGMPNAPATVEMAGAAHYNGHPQNQTIGHWITGFGYAYSGDLGYFADPATFWSSVSPKFTYTTANFWNIFIARHGNGLVY